jgi:hypothetical protein
MFSEVPVGTVKHALGSTTTSGRSLPVADGIGKRRLGSSSFVVRQLRKKQAVVASIGIQRIIVGMSEDKPPVFFIPGCQPGEQEEFYAAMAEHTAVTKV